MIRAVIGNYKKKHGLLEFLDSIKEKKINNNVNATFAVSVSLLGLS